MRSLDLRKEPSIRQTEIILRRIDEELTARGARVERAGAVGGLRFRMPRPWNAPRLGILLAITSGRAVVSAGSGGPWRVRYELRFSALRWTTLALTAILMAVGYEWNRGALINAVIALWITVYGVPYIAASIRFARIIRASAAEIVERRQRARAKVESSADTAGAPPHPVSSTDVQEQDEDQSRE